MATKVNGKKQTAWQGVKQAIVIGVPGAIKSVRAGWPEAVKMIKNFPTDLAKSYTGNGKRKTKSEMS